MDKRIETAINQFTEASAKFIHVVLSSLLTFASSSNHHSDRHLNSMLRS